jgi:hypothetical protein
MRAARVCGSNPPHYRVQRLGSSEVRSVDLPETRRVSGSKGKFFAFETSVSVEVRGRPQNGTTPHGFDVSLNVPFGDSAMLKFAWEFIRVVSRT